MLREALREAPRPDDTLSVGVVTLSPIRILWLLGSIAVVLAALSLTLQVVKLQVPDTPLLRLINFLDVDMEQNLPSFYNGALLLLVGLLVTLVATLKHQERAAYVRHWTVLAVGFCAMAADEMVSLHERVGGWILGWVGPQLPPFLYFAWVIPASGLVVGLAVAYLPFLRALPPRVRARFTRAAGLYLFGAIGMEMVGAAIFRAFDGPDSFLYALSTAVEEGSEMFGLSLFVAALLGYLAVSYGRLEVRIDPGVGGDAPD